MKNFPMYLPWLPERTQLVMRNAKTDLLMLDVQLGSACNARCPRCDSACASLNEPAEINLDALCKLAAEIDQRQLEIAGQAHDSTLPGGRNLGFVCGLGEPTVAENMSKLREILARTADYEFSWSMFSNGICWDNELEHYLETGRLFVAVQYNSNQLTRVARMLGVGCKRAAVHLTNRGHLLKIANDLNQRHIERTGESLASVAASIVPERDNLDELMELIAECARHGVFPLIGELENAGYAKDGNYHEQHKLQSSELQHLHQQIAERFGVDYVMPTCPATIGAIHINNRNIVTVDEFTGLSCGWFGMGDPKAHEIGDIREISYTEIVHRILEYRKLRIPEVRKAIQDYPEMVFGGCGGNARKLLADYVALYD